MEFNHTRIRIGGHTRDRDPQEELLGLDTRYVGDRPVTHLPLDHLVVVDELVVEVDVAGPVEVDGEGSVGGERVGFDGVGDEASWEAELEEEVVDVCGGCGGGEREEVGVGEEEEREEAEGG